MFQGPTVTSFQSRTAAFTSGRLFVALPLILVAALSCSSVVEPRSGVTLLVTNGSCLSGRCDSIEVLGFPDNQPRTPGGYWSVALGLITGSQGCLTLPPSATFRVIGVHNDGTADTTVYTWTPAASLSLGSIAPAGNRLQATPTTAAFVPANAAGWRVTLPGPQLIANSACAP